MIIVDLIGRERDRERDVILLEFKYLIILIFRDMDRYSLGRILELV